MSAFFVLTLEESSLRTEACLAHWKSRGLSPIPITGWHGDTLGLIPTNPYLHHEKGLAADYILPTHVGCILSHMLAMKVALLNDLDSFVIAEDDALLVEDFSDRFQALEEELEGFEVVQLAYNCYEDKLQRQATESLWQCQYPMSTLCTWWSRKGAIKALQSAKILDAPWDILLIRKVYPFLRHAIAKPALASYNVGEWPSMIHQTIVGGGKYQPPRT